MPVPFVLLQMRPEEDARVGELASVRRASGLGDRLISRNADRETLPVDLADRSAGVIVGGSPYSVSDPEASKGESQRLAERQLAALAERALERDLPVFFTCYGIGVLTLVLGGTVDRSHPEPVSAAENRLTDAGRADPVASVLPDRFTALTGHKESAPVPPPGAVLLATNDTSPVQLYRAGSVLASQFHPEPTTDDFARRAAVYQRHGYFPPGEYDAVAAALQAATVTEPQALLRRFVELAVRCPAGGSAPVVVVSAPGSTTGHESRWLRRPSTAVSKPPRTAHVVVVSARALRARLNHRGWAHPTLVEEAVHRVSARALRARLNHRRWTHPTLDEEAVHGRLETTPEPVPTHFPMNGNHLIQERFHCRWPVIEYTCEQERGSDRRAGEHLREPVRSDVRGCVVGGADPARVGR